MDNHQADDKELIFKETYKEKRRNKAREKRKKDQMSVTIFGIVVYSIVLIGIVVLSYVGFKSAIINKKERLQIAAEEAKNAKEAEKKALEAEKKAEEEALKAKALEEEEKLKKQKEEEEASEYKDTVFSVIENVMDPGNALVNSFEFARKTLDDESSKLMDYEVYTNPETKQITKITTRENCGDLYEITDYYYTDGKVNYIAQYREDTDVPIDLSGDNVESRFYYNSKSEMTKYIYCEAGKATEYSVEDFDLYSDGTKEQYRYMEKMLLDTSKTAFENAKKLSESVKMSGYVQDENNCPPPEAVNVELVDSNGKTIDETVTDGDGYYEFTVKPGDTEYNINFSCREDVNQTSVYGIKAPKGTKNIDVETVYLTYSVYDTVYPISIFVKDADNSSAALTSADVKFRYGYNNRDGEVCLVGVLGEAGEIMPQLRSGNYTVEVSKDGYETCYTSINVKADHNAFVIYAVKELKENSVKCVLSYETTPLDLDIKAFDTFGRNIYKSENDSVGITMAETISIENLDNGNYTFYCSDYTDIASTDLMSYNLSMSGAKMYVYTSDGLQEVYAVPAGHAGVVWRPFEVRNHKIITINDYYAYIVEDSIFRNK